MDGWDGFSDGDLPTLSKNIQNRKAELALECCAELSKQMRIASLHNGKVSPRDILETLAKYGQEN